MKRGWAGTAVVMICLLARTFSFVAMGSPSRIMTSLSTYSTTTDKGRPMYLGAFDFYSAWNRGDIDAAMNNFADDVIFHDLNNKDPLVGRQQLKLYLEECADALPGWKFIIDEHAWDEQQRKLALYWHVANSEGDPIPFPARGLSFLSFNEAGLIKTNVDIPEPAVKAGSLQLPLLKFVSKVFGFK
ncbi:unnamed protein product [Choristocarpus tenellus]